MDIHKDISWVFFFFFGKKSGFASNLMECSAVIRIRRYRIFCLDLHKTVSLGIFLLILGYLISQKSWSKFEQKDIIGNFNI